MSPENRSDTVNKLSRGAVLSHLLAGSALRCLRVLALPSDVTMMMGLNLRSAALGRKDIIKIEGYELTEAEAAKVALISPDATLAIIRDYKVHEKHELTPPASFRGLVGCNNPGCITVAEGMPGSFVVEHTDPVLVRCEYCDRSMDAGEFEFA